MVNVQAGQYRSGSQRRAISGPPSSAERLDCFASSQATLTDDLTSRFLTVMDISVSPEADVLPIAKSKSPRILLEMNSPLVDALLWHPDLSLNELNPGPLPQLSLSRTLVSAATCSSAISF